MNKTLLAGIAILGILGIFIIWNKSAQNNFRCPNDYATVEEYVTGVTEWARGELIHSPTMTKEELLSERERLFHERVCEPSRWSTVPGGL